MSITGCSPTPITPGIVVFVPADFTAAFPMFATVSSGLLTANFNLATLMLENSCCSVVKDANQREALLNLATAHITALLNGVNGQPPQGIVGRINAATEGSVSVSAEMLAKTESASYWQQSPWGAAFWQATLPFRLGRYVPPANDCDQGGMPWNSWPQ